MEDYRNELHTPPRGTDILKGPKFIYATISQQHSTLLNGSGKTCQHRINNVYTKASLSQLH